MAKETQTELSDLMVKLTNEKKSANAIQRHKHTDWNDNYELYRNRVKTNRLTQRQAVTIPLMKETVKTLLASIDDAPNVEWQELGGNEDKEIIYQELWNTLYRDNKVELIDIQDKKNVLLYGIGTKMLNISDTGIEIDTLDVFDVVFDPLMLNSQIETARFVVRQNIFRTIEEILADERYEKKGKRELERYLDTPAGLTQSDENRKRWRRKQERARDMGINQNEDGMSMENTLYAGGDRIINLTEHYTQIWDTKKKEYIKKVFTYADNHVLLLDQTVKEAIGVDFFPFVTWCEDPETNDIYSDGVADIVRTPNKVMNVWFSQLVENRTLKNFQMHWFTPVEGYTAQTYTPGPGVMIPAPPGENINNVIKPVEVNGLDDTMEAINYLTQIVERGTGATALEKGESEVGAQTLGEVEILVGKAGERAVNMAKFYRLAWYETCVKWDAMMHANTPKLITLYKTARSGKVYKKKIFASDWKSSEGYRPIVTSTSEQEQESINYADVPRKHGIKEGFSIKNTRSS